ncbi:MAG: CCA tRNA nucleotidyltransferase [Planctomycetota bacterium]
MTPREFALQVVEKLQAAGYQALWAGGCVRDAQMNRVPKDYDVATSATPDQVRELFGKQRTLPIGASFGVITVLGAKSAGPIEVATFRRDCGYSDGRRPDQVEFTDAREDALRRDFTINGMFFDPVANKVIDFVGGQQDLVGRQIRAIGDAHQRIEEDKLRMLRAVRFAVTLGFEIEAITLAAIKKHAVEIECVSGERIGAELRRMLAHPNRSRAAELLRMTGLLPAILPGADVLYLNGHWERCLQELNALLSDNFPAAVVLLCEPYLQTDDGLETMIAAWKLSNEEKKLLRWAVKHQSTLLEADHRRWSEVQPLLIEKQIPLATATLAILRSKVHSRQLSESGIEFCEERLAWPQEKRNPLPLIDGATLIEMGVRRGPRFKKILDRCRAMQLDGEIQSADDAKQIVIEMTSDMSRNGGEQN